MEKCFHLSPHIHINFQCCMLMIRERRIQTGREISMKFAVFMYLKRLLKLQTYSYMPIIFRLYSAMAVIWISQVSCNFSDSACCSRWDTQSAESTVALFHLLFLLLRLFLSFSKLKCRADTVYCPAGGVATSQTSGLFLVLGRCTADLGWPV